MKRTYYRGTVSRTPYSSEVVENNQYKRRNSKKQLLVTIPLEEIPSGSNSQHLKRDDIDAANLTGECHTELVLPLMLAQKEGLEVPFEEQALKIVDDMERDNSLMEDNPMSEQRRLDTLREMPESLTLKRTIRRKLITRVNQKARRPPLSFYKGTKYRISISLSKLQLAIKNIMYNCELWYSSIKLIEGHYGSGVATFFRFFRWIFIMNFTVFVISHSFIVLPQTLYDYIVHEKKHGENINNTDHFKVSISNDTAENSTLVFSKGYSSEHSSMLPYLHNSNFSIGNIFTGEGYFTNTYLYYGYYTNKSWEAIPGVYYSIPVAYFFTTLFCYGFIFISLSVSVAKSYRKSFIETAGGLKNVYAHKVLCGWDFSIVTKEAAELKSKSLFNELRELLSESEKIDEVQNWKIKCHILGVRSSVSLLTGIILVFTGSIMWVLLSANLGYDEDTRYQSSMMMSLIVTVMMIFSPVLFSWIIKFEEYDKPRTALFVTLFRTFLLSIVIIGVLLAFWLKRSYSDSHECWETSLGQEVYRLILMDFIIAIVGTALAEFVRKRIYMTLWETIGCPEFDIARNTLNLIYNETLFFVGFFFSPPLSSIIIIKMFITFYIKKVGVLKNCQPSLRSWRAAQTQTVFLMLSLFSLLCVIIVYGYILTNVEASDCGPFRGYSSMYQMILEEIFQFKEDHPVIQFFMFATKPGVVAGILIGMSVGVYYLRAQSRAQIHMVDIIQQMLLLEARDKEFLLRNISKVTEGSWMYNGQTNCSISSSSKQEAETHLTSAKITNEDSFSSSITNYREWPIKPTDSTLTDILSSTSSNFGEVARNYLANSQSGCNLSTASDSI